MKEWTFIVITPEDNEEELKTVHAETLESAIGMFFLTMIVESDADIFQKMLASKVLYAVQGDKGYTQYQLIEAFEEAE